MHRKLLAGITTIAAVLGSAAFSNGMAAPPMVVTVPSRPPLGVRPVTATPQNKAADAIPEVLLSPIRTRATLEDYVAQLVGQLRQADRDQNGLDAKDLEIRQRIWTADARASGVTWILQYDFDGDFRITKAELAEGSRSNPDNVRYQLERSDANGDGTITLEEAAQAGLRTRRQDNRPDAMLALDPDGDGKLTAAELKTLAERAFAIVDLDGDGTISASEDAAISENRNRAEWLRTAPVCTVPPVPSGAAAIALGVYSSQMLSSSAVGGQDQQTNLLDVEIERGSQPLYLVLSSHEAMVWRLTGDTARVAQVVVNSQAGAARFAGRGAQAPASPSRIAAVPMPRPGQLSASGVIGIPARKVAVKDADCWRYFGQANDLEGQRTLALIQRSLGKPVDAAFGSYSPQSVALPSGVFTARKPGAPPSAPADFDAEAWSEAIRFWSNGLAQVDSGTIVADAQVEPYSVLPSQMGLAQLAGSGAAVRLSAREYRVVKPIPHLPAQMTGAHSVTLRFAPGVPVPPGDPGHACIISEDTGARSGATCPRPTPVQ